MTDPAARFIWKLARRHSWGSPIPDNQLIRLVAGTEDHDELAWVLDAAVLERPFVVRSSEGIYIPNGQDAHLAAADWLRDHTALEAFTIKATFSRLPDDWSRDD